MPNELSLRSELIIPIPSGEAADVIDLNQIRKQVLKLHEKVSKSAIEGLRFMILAGGLLNQAKQHLSRGSFRDWVRESFSEKTGLGLRTAQRYMEETRKYTEFFESNRSLDNPDTEVEVPQTLPLLEEYSQLRLSLKSSKNKLTLIDPNEWESPPQVIQAVSEVLEGIDCDPCALGNSSIVCAELNLTPRENGLAKDQPWTDSVWISPGHDTNVLPWCEKALFEFIHGQLKQAILCLPISAPQLPQELLHYPIAISAEPLEVIEHQADLRRKKILTCRSLFIYLTTEAKNLEKFARAFRDIGVVFAPLVRS